MFKKMGESFRSSAGKTIIIMTSVAGAIVGVCGGIGIGVGVAHHRAQKNSKKSISLKKQQEQQPRKTEQQPKNTQQKTTWKNSTPHANDDTIKYPMLHKNINIWEAVHRIKRFDTLHFVELAQILEKMLFLHDMVQKGKLHAPQLASILYKTQRYHNRLLLLLVKFRKHVLDRNNVMLEREFKEEESVVGKTIENIKHNIQMDVHLKLKP
jgi:hypothetical protein